MTKYIAICAAVTTLVACQPPETESGETVSQDDAGMNRIQEGEANSGPVLAERSVEGVDELGVDLTTGDGVNDEKNDDLSVPPGTRYITYYLGTYGPKPQCTDLAKVLELEERSVRYGGAECQIENITADGNGIAIATNACMAKGQKMGDRTYTLDINELGEIKMTGAQNATLKRCGNDK